MQANYKHDEREKSSVTRRGVVTAMAGAALATVLPIQAEAGADELLFLIDSFRELRAHRILVCNRLEAAEVTEPSQSVKWSEIRPSMGANDHRTFYTLGDAERFFTSLKTAISSLIRRGLGPPNN